MTLQEIQIHRDHEAILKELLPIVHSSFTPSKYERLLLTILRNKKSSTQEFRDAANRLGEVLVGKIVECFPVVSVKIESPLAQFAGEVFKNRCELVSVMRSGDAILEIFVHRLPKTCISKILIQRDEESAQPIFKYMKLSSTIAMDDPVVIIEPMIATGGTLGLVIELLKNKGVKEKNIIVASLCAAPEGLLELNKRFSGIKVVLSVMDDRLNENKFIVPGFGDFGDRYFGN